MKKEKGLQLLGYLVKTYLKFKAGYAGMASGFLVWCHNQLSKDPFPPLKPFQVNFIIIV
jgi:hypothetical protein